MESLNTVGYEAPGIKPSIEEKSVLDIEFKPS